MAQNTVTSPVVAGAAPVAVPSSREQLRSKRKRLVRARTVNVSRLSKREVELERARQAVIDEADPLGPVQRPTTRADCVNGARPCPFVGCTHHLYLDVSPIGSIRLRFPDLEPSEMVESCALDVAARGGATLEHVGELMNVTRERVRQVEIAALAKVAVRLRELDMHDELAEGRNVATKRRLPLLPPPRHDDDPR